MKKKPFLAERSSVTKEQLEALYILACQLYHTECYTQAADLFRLLCFYQPDHVKGWIGLGGAHQHIKNHKAAFSSFLIASLHDPSNPEPKLYAAHALIDLKKLSLALKSAQEAVALCRNRGDQDRVRVGAELLYAALKNYLHLHPQQ